jgi:hypothetical protein
VLREEQSSGGAAVAAPQRLFQVVQHAAELADEERVAALVLQQRRGVAPAFVLLADAVLGGHLDINEEDFVQRVLADRVLDRPDVDTGGVGRQQEDREAAPA